LFCKPAAEFSVSDVARGLRAALVRQGHDLRDYDMGKRLAYHSRAMGELYVEQVSAVSKQASENILIEAMYHHADLVIIVSALIYHPAALVLLRMARVPTVVLHTESPYCDDDQVEWAAANPDALHCTHDAASARKLGWAYVPHSYDPNIHKPCREEMVLGSDGTPRIEWDNEADLQSDKACDVCFIGTGWPERIAFLEQVDWTGIDLRLYGLWTALREDSPLRKFYREGLVPNEEAVSYYRAAKININVHRADPTAESLNPRGFELPACGAFTLTDYRKEGVELFGDSMPVFETPADLERLVRHYLANPEERMRLARAAFDRVRPCLFDNRAVSLMSAAQGRFTATKGD
jgi:hypothetical protein